MVGVCVGRADNNLLMKLPAVHKFLPNLLLAVDLGKGGQGSNPLMQKN